MHRQSVGFSVLCAVRGTQAKTRLLCVRFVFPLTPCCSPWPLPDVLKDMLHAAVRQCSDQSIVRRAYLRVSFIVVGKSWRLDTYSTVPSQLSLSSSPHPPPPRFCNLGLEPLECCCLHSGLSSHFSCPHLDNHSQTSQRRVSLGDSRSFKLAIGINCSRCS